MNLRPLAPRCASLMGGHPWTRNVGLRIWPFVWHGDARLTSTDLAQTHGLGAAPRHEEISRLVSASVAAQGEPEQGMQTGWNHRA